jgi:cytochrome c-type biogenesis protein
MAEGYWLAVATALWLGVLTSISPCPLATNIAAISFIGQRITQGRLVLLAGLLYTLGRMLAYLVLGLVIVTGLLAIPALSVFLQKYMHEALGPLLIITGMFLLGLISVNLRGGDALQKAGERAAGWGLSGALALGVIFALAFCPTSAALFFGSLIPLAIEQHSRAVLPLLYGLGTALPVVACALVIAFSAQSLGRMFKALKAIELWARRVTGVVFIGVGIYLALRYVFNLF